MPALPQAHIISEFQRADAAAAANQRVLSGQILEDLMKMIVPLIPEVTFMDQDVVGASGNEELDLIFWHKPVLDGLYFLQTPFLVECKNWKTPADGSVITVFSETMRGRACRDGILVSAQGITGTPGELGGAYYKIAMSARDGRRIIVLNRADLEAMTTTDDLVAAIQRCVMDITLKQTLLK